MVATLANNPFTTTVGTGLFIDPSADGLVQGTAYPDPAVRYQLRRGWLSNNETLPMWGGLPIYENIPGVTTSTNDLGTSVGPLHSLGVAVGRATALTGTTGINGWSVFDQAYAMVSNPSSPVPLAGSYMQVNSYRVNSGARIAVACAPSLISLYGDPINQQVSWDFTNGQLVPYTAAYSQVTISGATWASTSGGQTTYTVGTDLTAILSAGSIIEVTGVVNTGGASTGAYNGQWVVSSVTDSTHVVVTAPASATLGTYSSGGHILAGGGALACTILEVKATNSMTVSYNATANTASWNYNGSAAIIQI